MGKAILAVIVGYALWTAVFLGSAAAIRAARADVHDAEGITSDTMTLGMYLVVSVIASFVAGGSVSIVTRSASWVPSIILALCLLGTGIPVQLSAWDKLPVWYNLVFLVLLVPVTLIGAGAFKPKAATSSE